MAPSCRKGTRCPCSKKNTKINPNESLIKGGHKAKTTAGGGKETGRRTRRYLQPLPRRLPMPHAALRRPRFGPEPRYRREISATCSGGVDLPHCNPDKCHILSQTLRRAANCNTVMVNKGLQQRLRHTRALINVPSPLGSTKI